MQRNVDHSVSLRIIFVGIDFFLFSNNTKGKMFIFVYLFSPSSFPPPLSSPARCRLVKFSNRHQYDSSQPSFIWDTFVSDMALFKKN